MKQVAVVAAVVLLSCSVLYADISVTDRSSTMRTIAEQSSLRPKADAVTPPDRAALRAANQAKRDAKRARQHAHGKGGTATALTLHPHAAAQCCPGISLIDSAGLQYFINTNLTFSTSSSASGSAYEASYQGPIVASTVLGGTVMSSPSDMFDGYQGLCVSLTNALGPCATGNANYVMYNKNGAATVDNTVPPAYLGRQYVYPAQTIGGLSVKRKVFVPTNDRYIRWMDIFTNTTGAAITFTAGTSNNLGSDNNTIIVNSSNGNATAEVTDLWITTFQNYSGSFSTDPRIGHIINGAGAPPLASVSFANGNQFPYWFYSITLNPGQTKIVVNFATGQGTKAAANAQAANLAAFGPNAQQAMSATEISETLNFAVADLTITKNTAAPIAFGDNPITYTLAVSNLGPSPASTVSVSDTLPAGSTFVSASGTGWACNNVAGVVTCTVATLPVGAAPVINLMFNAPTVVSAGTLSNTATVSSATSDSNPANNSSTKTVPTLPGSNIPALSTWMLMMLAAVLSAIALVRRT